MSWETVNLSVVSRIEQFVSFELLEGYFFSGTIPLDRYVQSNLRLGQLKLYSSCGIDNGMLMKVMDHSGWNTQSQKIPNSVRCY